MSLALASLVVALVISTTAAWVTSNSYNVILNAPDRTENHCATLLLGRKTEDEIQLKQRVVGSHDYLFIANYCSGAQKKLAGEHVKVCDSVGAYPPSVSAGAGRFSPLRVDCPLENEPCSELLSVDITLYCEPAPTNLNKL